MKAYILLGLGIAASVASCVLTRMKRDPNNLPHRPLHEIDIQGHQSAGLVPYTELCPGQYGYYLPSDTANEVFLFCWGSRKE